MYSNPSSTKGRNFFPQTSMNGRTISSKFVPKCMNNNKEFLSQKNFFKKDFKFVIIIFTQNVIENKVDSKLKIYTLNKKDFYSNYTANSKQNEKVGFIIHPNRVSNGNVKRGKSTVRINVHSNRISPLEPMFEHSIIEGGREFSIVSLISDISLGDQETMTSEKSTIVKFVIKFFKIRRKSKIS